MISNSSITYNLNSTERYIILNDLVFGTVYNISVAAVNSVGRGPFSNLIVVEIGIGMLKLNENFNVFLLFSTWSSWFSIQYYGYYKGHYLMEYT